MPKHLIRTLLLLALLLAFTSQVLADPPPHPEEANFQQQPPNPLQQPATTSAYGMDILGPAWQWTFPRESANPRLDGDMRIDQADEVFRKSWEAGVRSARLAAWWCFLEPERDQYEWEDMDIMVQLLSNYGIEPIPEILYTPYWARAAAPAPQTSCIDNWQRNYRPDDMSDWEAFMGEIVRRYGPSGKNQVRYWEIWNEPDLPEFLSRESSHDEKTVCIYSRLLKAASRQVRSRDPSARILLGGLSDINGPGFLDDLLGVECGLDARDDFDILAFHAFTAHDIKVFFLNRVLEKHDAVGRYELWLNEFNNIGWGKDYDRADREIGDLFDLVFDADVTRTFWFKAWTTKWQADWTVGIFEDRDPLWVPGPFTPSPFYDSFEREAFSHPLAGAPQLAQPGANAITAPRPTFTWARPSSGAFPIAGYKLQVDDSTYQGTPYFHAPEIDVWVTSSNTHFLPLQMSAGRSAATARTTAPLSPPTDLAIPHSHYQTPVALSPGRYFWRVAAVDAEGNVGPYSEVRILYVSPGDKRSFLPLLLH
jgi:hypothetical protein